MDSDFWTSRLAATKRQFIHHHHNHNNHLNSQLDRLNFDDFEVEEEVRPHFPCPYCYEDFDTASLCSHLEDEHSCESRVTGIMLRVHQSPSWCLVGQRQAKLRFKKLVKKVCPVCSVKVTRDMLSHVTLQHGHLFNLQRRRRLRRVAVPNSLSLLGRDLREAHLQVLLGGGGYRSSSATSSTAVTDPLLSSLFLNFPASEAEEISKAFVSCVEDLSTKSVALQHIWKSSFDPSLSIEELEKRMRQAAGKAVFMQDLLISTLLTE